MAAAIRLSRKHLGLTATNPAVTTLIVRDDGEGPVIVGRAVTAIGGRPHAEPQALEEAGALANGATAYVTLEPCAHHGRTPPCAEALITAGIARVVGGASDPDDRVSGRGYAMLRDAGITVIENVLADQAADQMAGYLIRSNLKRPEVMLKLALSADGMIGIRDHGEVAITGEIARAQVHLMRAESDMILVGVGTALADDPALTCRLPGLEQRSPQRIVLDSAARMSPSSTLAQGARQVPVLLATGPDIDPQKRAALEALGVEFLACDMHEGRIALPELLEDLAGRGMSTLMIEGGAETARSFLEEELVDRLCVFRGPSHLGENGIAAPLSFDDAPAGFKLIREATYGEDHYREWRRV